MIHVPRPTRSVLPPNAQCTKPAKNFPKECRYRGRNLTRTAQEELAPGELQVAAQRGESRPGVGQRMDDGAKPGSDGLPLPSLFSEKKFARLVAQLKLPKRLGEVAYLICRGCDKPRIARELGISRHTAAMHCERLFRKLDVHDRVGVVVRIVMAERSLKR